MQKGMNTPKMKNQNETGDSLPTGVPLGSGDWAAYEEHLKFKQEVERRTEALNEIIRRATKTGRYEFQLAFEDEEIVTPQGDRIFHPLKVRVLKEVL